MRNYAVTIQIRSTDGGPEEHAEIALGRVQAENVKVLAQQAHGIRLGAVDAVAEHERLVALQGGTECDVEAFVSNDAPIPKE